MEFDHHTLVILMLRPDAPTQSPQDAGSLQDAHLAFIAEQVDAGHILAAGPPVDQDDETLRGLSLWSVDADSARQLAATDPAVLAGRLAVQVSTWMVPAGQVRFERVRVPRSIADALGP